METSVKDRIMLFIEHSGLSQKGFERAVGLSNGYLAKLRHSPTADKVQRILSVYPQLNSNWLLFGEGDMLAVKPRPPITLSAEGMRSPDYHTFLVPVSARAGALVDIKNHQIGINECERIVSPVAGADFAITIVGDSMHPRYPAGSYVFVKQVNIETFIEWGRSYVLDTTNGVIIREIQPHEDGRLLCHSINPSGKFKDFYVRLADIRAMFKILATVNLG